MGDVIRMKSVTLRDRKYLDWLRTQRCIVTGRYASEYDAVDPCHLGVSGIAMKSPDDEVLPMLHSIHVISHQTGEVSTQRRSIPDDVLMSALRAYAREMYREWKETQ